MSDRPANAAVENQGQLIDRAKLRLPGSDLALLQKACDFWPDEFDAGEPRFERSLAIASILNEWNADGVAIAVALHLAWTVDSDRKTDTLLQSVTPDERRLLNAFLDLTKLELRSGLPAKSEHEKMERLRKVFLIMAQDIRVVLLRLADQLHVMRTLDRLPVADRHKCSEESMQIYAPLANRLGIWQLKSELEDRAFAVLDPQTYKQIFSDVSGKQDARRQYIETVRTDLIGKLRTAGIPAAVKGRPKHIHSIWAKMRRKDVDLDRIYDAYAVRVLVDNVTQCYMTLGLVHELWHPISGEFDDYIAQPKANGYRSIHTAVVGPEGENLEVQIRTHQMDSEAEFGVAAHWRYKERDKEKEKEKEAAVANKPAASLRQLLEWSQCIDAGCRERDRDGHTDTSGLFAGRVLVFTPQNDLIDLDEGSTPLDFAYHVHSQIGHRCRGARVNDKLVSLKTLLKTGDKVEILTGPKPSPSRDWMEEHSGFCGTAHSRAKVRSWFRKQDRTQNIAAGREMVDRELKRLRFRSSLASIADALNYGHLDDFFAAVGNGDISLNRVVSAVERLTAAEQRPPEEMEFQAKQHPAREAQGIDVLQGLVTQTARCCNPLPGDVIKGFLSRGRGLIIHKADCSNLAAQTDAPRIVNISWQQVRPAAYPARLEIMARPRSGLMRDIAGKITELEVNMLSVKAQTIERKDLATVSVVIEVSSVGQLKTVMDKINNLTGILKIERG